MKNNKTIVAIIGGYGQGNTGDEAILSEIVRQLKRSISYSRLHFIVFSYDKEKTLNASKMEWLKVIGWSRRYLSIKWIFDILKTLYTIDMLIIGGGSVIYDASILPLSLLILFCKILNKKVMCYAIGASHIRGIWQRFLACLTLNTVDLITVRDVDAREYLARLHIIKPTIIVTADPAMTLNAKTSENIVHILSLEDIIKDETPLVGISMRNWSGMADDPIIFDKIKVILREVVRHLIEQLNLEVVFIPLSFFSSMEWDDRIAAHELIETINIKEKSRINIIEGEYLPEEISGILGSMDMVIGMRLHSLIFAANQGVPIVAINYDPKIKGFMKMINQQDKIIEFNDPIDKASEIVKRVWMNRKIINEELKTKTSILRKRAIINASLAIDLLQKH